MKRFFLILLAFIPCLLIAQKAEKQISFARELKPHSYYVEQAELWWHEIEKDSLSEDHWYNYFRACRNSHGTADWKSDFILESPYLKTGDQILESIKRLLTNTFTFHYLSYLNNGIGTEDNQSLLKAYSMNPDFEGIHSSVISYAESALDTALRKRVNKEWYKTNYESSQLLNYGYNVLMSLDRNSILFTTNDNDTYPLWMLQDALDIRTDVWVINIDFLLLEDYRKHVYRKMEIPELELKRIELDDYHSNWKKVLSHVLANYSGKQNLYLGMTVAREFYIDFEKNLFTSGLAFKFSKTKIDLEDVNKDLYENVFLLDYLEHSFINDVNQFNVDYQNINYLYCFKIIYKQYKKEKRDGEAQKLKEVSIKLANRLNQKEYLEWVEKEFK